MSAESAGQGGQWSEFRSGFIDDACSRFEMAWRAGQPPQIEDFLPVESPDKSGATRLNFLVQLVGIDLEWRWKTADTSTETQAFAGQEACHVAPDSSVPLPPRPRLVDYVARYALLGSVEQLPNDLIVNEYYVRRRYGDRPTHAEYLGIFGARNPELAKQLQAIDDGMAAAEHLPSDLASEDERPLGSTVQYLGDYVLLEQIGKGGMGVVYKAKQVSLKRQVAVKMIRAGQLAGEEDFARFRSEAESAASLDHPNIVQIYEIGEHQGQHYFSMRYVEGESLADRLKTSPLPACEAARLIEQVARAIAYAHGRGVIHRDLKPANIIVDRQNQPHVTDFGLAKRVQGDSDLTASGQVLGTPSYMPPEQAAGRLQEISEQSDIYSLGATLYALLVGRPPFQADNPLDTLVQVREQEPVSLRRLNPNLPRDLETICAKCLEKVPSRRYSTATEFAAELRRFLDGKPIHARPVSRPERLWRWCLREPIIAGLSAAAAALLLLAAIVASVGYVRTSQALAGEKAARQEAVENENVAKEQRQQAQQSKTATERVLVDMYASAGLRADERGDPYEAILWFANAAAQSRDDPDRLRANSLRFDSWSRRMWLPVRAVRLPPENRIGWVDFHPSGKFLLIHAYTNKRILWDVVHDKFLDLPGGERPIMAGQWNPQGDRLVLATPEGQVTLYSFPDGKRLRQFQQPGSFCSLNFSEDGRYLGLASETVHVWDCQSEQAPPQVFSHPARVWSLTFSPRCDRLATACEDGLIRVFALGKPSKSEPLFQPIPNPKGIPPLLVNGGKELITVSGDHDVAWWNTETGERLRTEICSGDLIWGLKKHPGGNAFAVFGGAPIDVWSLASSAWTKRTLEGHQNEVFAVDWFLNDALQDLHPLLVSVSRDRKARVWCCESNTSIATLPHQDEVSQVACSKNGCWIATVQKSQLVRIWTLPDSPKTIHIPDDAADHHAIVSRDGCHLMPAGWWHCRASSSAQIYKVEGGEKVGEPIEAGGDLNGGAISPKTDLVVTLGSNTKKGPIYNAPDWGHLPGQILFWKFPLGKQCFSPLKTSAEPVDADFNPDGRWLAVVCAEGTVLLIDSQTGRMERKYEGHSVTTAVWGYKPDHWIRFSPRGDCFLTANFGSEVRIRFLDNKKQEVRIKLEGTVRHAEFSSNGRLVVAAYDNKVRVFDVLTGEPLGLMLLHPDWAFRAHFSSDSRVLLTACRDHMARLWNWRDDAEPFCAMQHVDEVSDASFSANNRWVITVGRDAALNVWDCAGGMRVMPSAGLSGNCEELLFSPDRKHVVTSGLSRFVDIFDLSELLTDENGHADGNWRLPWAEIISGRQLSKNGTVNLSMEEWCNRWQQFTKSYPQVPSRISEQKIDDQAVRERPASENGSSPTVLPGPILEPIPASSPPKPTGGALSLSAANLTNLALPGSQLTYEIRLTNKQNAPYHQVVVTATVPEGMTPIALGAVGATIDHETRTIRFAPIAELLPDKTQTYRVPVLAKQPGTYRLHVEMATPDLPKPMAVDSDETTVSK